MAAARYDHRIQIHQLIDHVEIKIAMRREQDLQGNHLAMEHLKSQRRLLGGFASRVWNHEQFLLDLKYPMTLSSITD